MTNQYSGTRTVHCLNCGASIAEPPPSDNDSAFDDQRHSVRGIRLTRQEWALLQIFRRHPGRLITREQAIQAIWGETYEEPEWSNATVKALVCHIRQKLARVNVGWRIDTVWGEGYIGHRVAEQLVSPEP
jgi:DNA-binding response OmpR family regulator